MSIIDSLTGLLNGSGKSTVPVDMLVGEVELSRVCACTLKAGSLPWVGGDLVLTNIRLLFTPLNMKDAAALLTYGLSKAGAPVIAVSLVGRVARLISDSSTEMTLISTVVPHLPPALFHPPTLIVQMTDGRALEFGIAAKRTSLSISQANVAARDQFIQTVLQSLPNR